VGWCETYRNRSMFPHNNDLLRKSNAKDRVDDRSKSAFMSASRKSLCAALAHKELEVACLRG
jgi:hypothetical protein